MKELNKRLFSSGGLLECLWGVILSSSGWSVGVSVGVILSRSGWSVGVSVGSYLDYVVEVGRLAHCGWRHSLDSEFWTV